MTNPESLERAREWAIHEKDRVLISVDSLAALIDSVRAEERERCAKIAEAHRHPGPVTIGKYIAAAIRAAGEPPK